MLSVIVLGSSVRTNFKFLQNLPKVDWDPFVRVAEVATATSSLKVQPRHQLQMSPDGLRVSEVGAEVVDEKKGGAGSHVALQVQVQWLVVVEGAQWAEMGSLDR